ncbi:DUF1961 family protein [Paenalkalicoccus suaedae]|uniref:DUF1961 family protein n=1 Tax=Paenalkalicoccus suaedae TaxID=2592382 RepID=A0A859FA33_9BACI|nr:DUF1961 family protein [Paenalkalicoccus suaedae]QKS69740.1 DUF1961 family protein [Paenalkalicoccus suaedae]
MTHSQELVTYDHDFSDNSVFDDWIFEGPGKGTIESGRLVLESTVDAEAYEDHAHWVLWCKQRFSDHIKIEWTFLPLEEPGLCMIFFSADGKDQLDLFDSSLSKRTGYYPQYHSSDIHALHLSYFRHRHPEERHFRTCNLRKSAGFHLCKTAADPLPPAKDALEPYRMKLIKSGKKVSFSINDFPVLDWEDDGKEYGPTLKEGYIGFRQMAPMRAAYSDFSVTSISPRDT